MTTKIVGQRETGGSLLLFAAAAAGLVGLVVTVVFIYFLDRGRKSGNIPAQDKNHGYPVDLFFRCVLSKVTTNDTRQMEGVLL